MRNSICVLLFAALAVIHGFATTPVPFITGTSPSSAILGSGNIALTVYGVNFVTGQSAIYWNGVALTTTCTSATSTSLSACKATVSVARLTAGTASITVLAPGGIASNVMYFPMTRSNTTVTVNKRDISTGAGTTPEGLVVSDFNSDGKLDIAATSFGSNSVAILTGDGRGNFTLGKSIATGAGPRAIAAADFNGDRKADLAVANMTDGTVTILLGNGSGAFTAVPTAAPVGRTPRALMVGDFNADGYLDLAVVNQGDSNVTVLLGDGTGHFAFSSVVAVGNFPDAIVAGDFNADGHFDLAVADFFGNNIAVLIGDGTGHFSATPSSLSSHTIANPAALATGDFNGDGILDLAVGNFNDAKLTILLGDGLGNFNVGSTAPVPFAADIKVGDFNGDGRLDLVVASECTDTNCDMDGALTLFLGDGKGDFTPPGPAWSTNLLPLSVGIGDFNRDGTLDFAVQNTSSANVSVFLQPTLLTPVVTLSPASLSFNVVDLQAASPAQNVTLKNTGVGSLHLTGIGTTTGGDFSQINNCGVTLAAGASCVVRVTFAPTVIGPRKASLTFADDAANNPQTVIVTGVGTAAALSPTSLSFASTVQGTSATQTVTLTNKGTSTLNIWQIAISPQESGNTQFRQSSTCARTLAPRSTCSIRVTFSPNAIGIFSARLLVSDDGGGSPQSALLLGTGTSSARTRSRLPEEWWRTPTKTRMSKAGDSGFDM